MAQTLREHLVRQLCDSVERLQEQVEKVEILASALCGASTPVPDYQPDDNLVARFVKPARPRKKRRRRAARR